MVEKVTLDLPVEDDYGRNSPVVNIMWNFSSEHKCFPYVATKHEIERAVDPLAARDHFKQKKKKKGKRMRTQRLKVRGEGVSYVPPPPCHHA